jgi:hypothetical protein
MGSITLVSAHSKGPTAGARLRRWLLALAFGLVPLCAWAGEFSVRNADTNLVEGVYLLDAHVDYSFSAEALKALDNGIPLTIRLDIEVQRKRSWWFDADVASLEQRYQLRYHAFSEQYLVRNLNSGALYTYPTLASAVEALGDIRDFPLLDEKLIKPHAKYEVELRAYLDIEALPSPLRPLAYITPAWHLGSEWYKWSLTP